MVLIKMGQNRENCKKRIEGKKLQVSLQEEPETPVVLSIPWFYSVVKMQGISLHSWEVQLILGKYLLSLSIPPGLVKIKKVYFRKFI